MALYLGKFCQLYEAVADSIESERYLIYSAAGGAILENATTLRYYSQHLDLTALASAWGTPTMSSDLLEGATNTLDKLCRGNGFTWDALVAHRFDELSNAAGADTPSRINIATCLDKGHSDKPQMRRAVRTAASNRTIPDAVTFVQEG